MARCACSEGIRHEVSHRPEAPAGGRATHFIAAWLANPMLFGPQARLGARPSGRTPHQRACIGLGTLIALSSVSLRFDARNRNPSATRLAVA